MSKPPEWDRRNDREIIGEWAVYPGHPITVAYVITKVFATFEEAFKTSSSGPPNALCANAVPGAGGCVYSAMSLLKRLREGMAVEEAFKWADETWGRIDSMREGGCKPEWREQTLKKYREGQAQADRFKEKLKAQMAWWEASSQSVRDVTRPSTQ